MARIAVTFVVLFTLFALSDARLLGRRFAAPESTGEPKRDSPKPASPTTNTVPVDELFDVSSSSDDTVRSIGLALPHPFPEHPFNHDPFGRHHDDDLQEIEFPLGNNAFKFSGRIPIEPMMPTEREEGGFMQQFRNLVKQF